MTIDKIAARLGSLRGKYKAEREAPALITLLYSDVPKLLEVARAAKKASGHTPYCICEKVMNEDQKCRCGNDTLVATLAALEQT